MTAPFDRARIRFDRHELAGAFGDIGTDLPLIIALIATCKLDAASVCIVFGLLQMTTGLLYGIPMPVQPLKAMAAIMLAQKLSGGTLAGGGLVIGVSMLVFAVTGTLDWLARVVPKEVIRGIQFGLGVTLATLAVKDYVSADATFGYVLAVFSVALLLVFRRQKTVPAPLIVICLGVAYALVRMRLQTTGPIAGLSVPKFSIPTRVNIEHGALLLALPQIPLSLGNSVIATSQTSRDLFPDRAVSVRKIGITYGVMNLIAPFFSGLPVCHGCGGMVGFYGFGARTGGAPIIYGALYVLVGAIFAPGFLHVIEVFPKPVLGVILLFEAIGLMMFLRDIALDRNALWIALIVALVSAFAPFGFLSALIAGTILSVASRRGWLRLPVEQEARATGEVESRARGAVSATTSRSKSQ